MKIESFYQIPENKISKANNSRSSDSTPSSWNNKIKAFQGVAFLATAALSAVESKPIPTSVDRHGNHFDQTSDLSLLFPTGTPSLDTLDTFNAKRTPSVLDHLLSQSNTVQDTPQPTPDTPPDQLKRYEKPKDGEKANTSSEMLKMLIKAFQDDGKLQENMLNLASNPEIVKNSQTMWKDAVKCLSSLPESDIELGLSLLQQEQGAQLVGRILENPSLVRCLKIEKVDPNTSQLVESSLDNIRLGGNKDKDKDEDDNGWLQTTYLHSGPPNPDKSRDIYYYIDVPWSPGQHHKHNPRNDSSWVLRYIHCPPPNTDGSYSCHHYRVWDDSSTWQKYSLLQIYPPKLDGSRDGLYYLDWQNLKFWRPYENHIHGPRNDSSWNPWRVHFDPPKPDGSWDGHHFNPINDFINRIILGALVIGAATVGAGAGAGAVYLYNKGRECVQGIRENIRGTNTLAQTELLHNSAPISNYQTFDSSIDSNAQIIYNSPSWKNGEEVQKSLIELKKCKPGTEEWTAAALDLHYEYEEQMKLDDIGSNEFNELLKILSNMLRHGGCLYKECENNRR